MDSTRHTVLLLNIELGKSVLYRSRPLEEPTLVDGGVANISLRGGIDNISDLETLHSLILHDQNQESETYLTNAATAMRASDGVDMTSSLLGTSVVSTNRESSVL